MIKRDSILISLCLLASVGATALTLKFGQQATPVEPRANPNNALVSNTTPATPSAKPAQAVAWQNDIKQLRAELEESKREREELREEMITLQAQISTLQDGQQAQVNEISNTAMNDQGSVPPTTEAIIEAHRSQNGMANGFGFGPPSNEERERGLLAAGVDEQTIASITERSDQFELARLELIDRASREGFRRTDQFRDEMSELNESRVSIRDEIGEDAYDTYLANAGRDNRVVVESIINGSAASIAGMQVGDIIYAYAGSRMFSSRELQQATREGNRGELIDIQVQRPNAGQYTFTVERGPLGVTLGTVLDRS